MRGIIRDRAYNSKELRSLGTQHVCSILASGDMPMPLRIRDLDVHANATTNTLYLIPAEESASGEPEITVFAVYGSGCPERAWNHRWYALAEVKGNAVLEEVDAVITKHTQGIELLAASYQGTRWNGQNHVGVWDEDFDAEALVSEIREDLAEVPTYWRAGDYYEPARGDLLREIAATTKTLDEFVASEIEDARAQGNVHLRADDVREFIGYDLQRWFEEHAEPEPGEREYVPALRAKAIEWTRD